MSHFDPADSMIGGFTSRDGTVEFYSRVNALLRPDFKLLDLGAGRGAWHFMERSPYKRKLREFHGKVAEYIGADVDPAVLGNPTTDRNSLIVNGQLPFGDGEFDIIVSDWVLEHIVDVGAFTKEVERVLKSGGYFCARTPHSFSYWTIAARLVKNSSHVNWLRLVQPKRKPEDAFPTAYRFNTLGAVGRRFSGWQNFSYIYTAEPSYYFGRKQVFNLLNGVHRVAPRAMTGSLFIFLCKP
jgi:SAM-dependent methyltransferase